MAHKLVRNTCVANLGAHLTSSRQSQSVRTYFAGSRVYQFLNITEQKAESSYQAHVNGSMKKKHILNGGNLAFLRSYGYTEFVSGLELEFIYFD
jgi:hypothetical protein